MACVHSNQPSNAREQRVLVVEDNPDTVHSFAKLVSQLGHKVEFATNGYAAVDLARSFRPEIVFVDLGLPGLDGHEVARRLRAELGAQVRIIVVTAYGTDEDREASAQAGCEHHLVKPVDPQFIVSLLR
jgi:CheY-like chemotaxis protein